MKVLEEVDYDEAFLIRESFWKDKLRHEYNIISERKQ